MDWEQIYELFQSGRHPCIKATELFEVLAYDCFLFRCLLQNTLRHDIGGCFFRDNKLSEPVADMLQCISNKAKARIIKNLFLHTENDTQFGLGTHLAKSTEKLKVENDFSLITG